MINDLLYCGVTDDMVYDAVEYVVVDDDDEWGLCQWILPMNRGRFEDPIDLSIFLVKV